MNKCFEGLTVIVVTLISATALEDICESCVLLSKCTLFTSMDKTEQQPWMQKYPCNNHHPDDYGTPPGSRAAQGDFICCPNQIRRIDTQERSSSRLTDANRFGNPQSAPGAFSDQNKNPYYSNFNRQNKDSNYYANNDEYINLLANKQRDSDQNTYSVEPTRWSSTSKSKYWNERPDKNKWDIGNQNFYQGNNNRRGSSSNWRNYFDNNQATRTNQPESINNQGSGRNRNDSKYPYYPRNQRPSDSFNKPDQCDRLTRLPPDPQTGCCGREATDDDRITGGKATELTQYPWTALLITTFDDGMQRTAFNCGGSVISSRFVLTAGHCVYDDVADIKSVQVFLAEFDKRTFPRDCKTTGEGRKCIDNIAMYAENVILHPRFDETRLQNDIALIKLQTDVPYTDYIRPICLPSINIDDPEHARLTLTVSGWGRNGQYKSDVKQSTTVHLVPQYDCRKFYPDLTPRHLCAAGYTGEDTCKGDSGGPLMVLYRGTYFVVGVVSGKRTDAPCGSAVPSLYTNVYHYLDWIRSNLNS